MPNSKLILSTLLISISPVEFCLPLSARPSRGYDRIDTTFRLQVPTVSSGGGKGESTGLASARSLSLKKTRNYGERSWQDASATKAASSRRTPKEDSALEGGATKQGREATASACPPPARP